MNKVNLLRKKYPQFIYESYSSQLQGKNLVINFHFEIKPGIRFNPVIIIKNINHKTIRQAPKEVLDNLIFHLGLIESISYWKLTCSPEIIIRAGYLNREQIKWWKKIIFKGLGQFFFTNKINFLEPKFVTIKSGKKHKIIPKFKIKSKSNHVLVPIGGGKDSIVTLETLRKNKKNLNISSLNCFALNPNPTIIKVFKKAKCSNPLVVERKIDNKLLILNQKGYLNGHTPISAYLAFLSLLVSFISGYNYILFSNERSSNEGNIYYLGKLINHQWSKSFEFEKGFRSYVKKFLGEGIEYISFLRPLYELQIVRLFVNYPKYFKTFLSCNEAYRTYSGTVKPLGRWCNHCPKCLFVFTSLFPFIGQKRVKDIFGENLFDKKELLPLMLELLGEKKFKPFECVGTKEETKVAFYLSLQRAKKKKSKLPFLLNYFKINLLPKFNNIKREEKIIFNGWNNNNFLTPKLKKILKNEVRTIKK